MNIRGMVLLGCAVLLTACSSGDGGAAGGGSESVLEGMKSERLCELLSTKTVEQTLGVVVTETTSKDVGRPPILFKSCRYAVDYELQELDTLPPSVSTSVDQTLGKSVEELLDDAFTDPAAETETVSEYEKVDGLGEGAAFGANPMIDGGLEESQLVVVFTAGGERLTFDVAVSPETTLENLRPLATELLAGLQAELG